MSESADADWVSGPALSVWRYDSPRGAAAGEMRLTQLRRRGAVDVLDATTVTWAKGAHRPRIRHSRSVPGGPPSSSPLVALLVRLLDPDPAHEDAVPDLAERLNGTGIDEGLLQEVREFLAPDTSALLVISTDANLADVQAVIERGRARGDVRLLHAPLTEDGLVILQSLPPPDLTVPDGVA